MVKDLLDLAKNLLGLKADLDKSVLERRQRVATYLNNISDCLNQSVKKFREGEVPASLCSEVDEYLYSLFDIVGEEVGEEKLERYKQILANALVYKGRTISAFLQGTSLESVADSGSLDVIPKSKLQTVEADLRVLEDAAGRFKALANSMQV
ncbi:hypothetical protein [Phormidesmis priestleyi]|nr:hypothetical protein [Phormidesmis priestleyi]